MKERFSSVNRRALAWSCILATHLSGCGGRVESEREQAPPFESPRVPIDESPQVPVDASCVQLSAPAPETEFSDLQIEYGCGYQSADAVYGHTDWVVGGERCEGLGDLNTFALRLTGSAAGRYSAVVRCGYIRYDNGNFVGERVDVEARDGEWCHEPALERIELVDRMLLTDVSFAIEATDMTAPPRHLIVQFSSRSGWMEPVPAETNLCAYVAHRESGHSACGMVSPASYCLCPCGKWEDFFQAMELSLAKR